MTTQPDDNIALRKILRAKRRTLSAAAQKAHSLAASKALLRWGLYLRFESVAIYIANDGELDPGPLTEAGFQRNKQLLLPVLRPGRINRLWFAAYTPDTHMVKNRFGIAEPSVSKRALRTANTIDAVLLPLVGFDRYGNRLGMGGGYYDRTLASLRYRRAWRRPLLIGLAHHCQCVDRIRTNRWDIPLDLIVSECGVHAPRR